MKFIAAALIAFVALTGCVFDGNVPGSTGCDLVEWAAGEGIASYHGDTDQWRFGIATDDDWFLIIVLSEEEDRCFQPAEILTQTIER